MNPFNDVNNGLEQLVSVLDGLQSSTALSGSFAGVDQVLQSLGVTKPTAEINDVGESLDDLLSPLADALSAVGRRIDFGLLDKNLLDPETQEALLSEVQASLSEQIDSAFIKDQTLFIDFREIQDIGEPGQEPKLPPIPLPPPLTQGDSAGPVVIPPPADPTEDGTFTAELKLPGFSFTGAPQLEILPVLSTDFTLGFNLRKPDATGLSIAVDKLDLGLTATLKDDSFGIDAPIAVNVRDPSLMLDAGINLTVAKDDDPATMDRLSIAELRQVLAGNPPRDVVLDATPHGALEGELPLDVEGFPLSSAEPVIAIDEPDIFDTEPADIGFDLRITDRAEFLDTVRSIFGIDDEGRTIPGQGLAGSVDRLLAPPLPFIGTQLQELNFADDVGRAVVGSLDEALGAEERPLLGHTAAEALANGLGGLVKQTLDPDALLRRQPDAIEFALPISSSLTQNGFLNFGKAIPGLGLKVQGDAGICLGAGFELDLGLGFGLDEGLYLQTAAAEDRPELRLGAAANLDPESRFDASLGFLNLAVTDRLEGGLQQPLQQALGPEQAEAMAAALTQLGPSAGEFDLSRLGSGIVGVVTADLKDPGNGDGRLTLGELANAPLIDEDDVPGVVEVDGKVLAHGHLDAQLALGSGAAFPGISTELILQQAFDFGRVQEPGAPPSIELRNVSLDLGEFVQSVAGPTLRKIRQVIAPVQPVLEAITDPIPIISPLAEKVGIGPVSLLSLARKFASARELDFLDVASDVSKVLRRLPAIDDDGSAVTFRVIDSVQLAGSDTNIDLRPGGQELDEVPLPDPDKSGEIISEPQDRAQAEELKNFVEALTALDGLKIPILEDPGSVLGLLVGKNVELIDYDVPALNLRAGPVTFLEVPVLGLRVAGRGIGLFASLRGGIEATADFDFGFDSLGLKRFFETDNPSQLLNGFFVDDHPRSSKSELELAVDIAAVGSVDALIARGELSGGVTGTLGFDLRDPNRDGKVRASELDDLLAAGIFDRSGRIEASLRGRLSASIPFFPDPSISRNFGTVRLI